MSKSKFSDIPLRLGLARFGDEFSTTHSIGELKENTTLQYCTRDFADGYPQYKIKLRGTGEFYFFDEATSKVFVVVGGVDGHESIVDALLEKVEHKVPAPIKQKTVIPVLFEQPIISSVKGDIGERGERGETGSRGMMGQEGPQGLRGEKGDAGRDGSDGDLGPQGTQGLTGPQGEKGEIGDRGETGQTGSQGLLGPQGVSGSTGEKGVAGPQGDQGIPGPQGEQGLPGEQGAAGPVGKDGTNGAAGPQGLRGPEGSVGSRGDIGPIGPMGANGAAGPQGEVGVVAATYPLKLDDNKTLSIEQKFFAELVDGATSKHSAQGGGGGNLIVKREGLRLSSAAHSINFTGSGISSAVSDGKNINIDITGGGGSATNLDDLTDVVIVSPTLSQVLTYNGTNWVNAAAAASTIDGGSF